MTHETLAQLGRAFRNWRLDNGITQTAVARRSGFVQARISALESGEGWTLQNLEKIAQSMGLDPSKLYAEAYAKAQEARALPLFAGADDSRHPPRKSRKPRNQAQA